MPPILESQQSVQTQQQLPQPQPQSVLTATKPVQYPDSQQVYATQPSIAADANQETTAPIQPFPDPNNIIYQQQISSTTSVHQATTTKQNSVIDQPPNDQSITSTSDLNKYVVLWGVTIHDNYNNSINSFLAETCQSRLRNE